MGKVQRFGSISRVKPEKLEYYKNYMQIHGHRSMQ